MITNWSWPCSSVFYAIEFHTPDIYSVDVRILCSNIFTCRVTNSLDNIIELYNFFIQAL